MKKLLLIIFIFPMLFSCEKEEAEPSEPLAQFHFINFVDASGNNLFENNKIQTTDFFYLSGDLTVSWEDLIMERTIQLSEIKTEEFQKTVTEILEKNEYILVENFQGERERVISINGEEYTFKMSPLKDGFFKNGEKLESSTDTVDSYKIYIHHIILDEF